MDYFHLVNLIKDVLEIDWEPEISPRALQILNRCDSKTEKLYIIGAAYYVEQARNRFMSWPDDTKLIISTCFIEYNSIEYEGIWFNEPWFAWYELSQGGPSACAFVPQLKFKNINYHHDFGLFYNSDNGGAESWNLNYVIEIDPDHTHNNRKDKDAYRDSIVDYEVVRICEDVPNYLTWFKEIIRKDGDKLQHHIKQYH